MAEDERRNKQTAIGSENLADEIQTLDQSTVIHIAYVKIEAWQSENEVRLNHLQGKSTKLNSGGINLAERHNLWHFNWN